MNFLLVLFSLTVLCIFIYGCYGIYKRLSKRYNKSIVKFATIVLSIAFLFSLSYLLNNFYNDILNDGYEQGVVDCKTTITENISRGASTEGEIVFFTEHGTVVHKKLNCQYLRNKDIVFNAPLESKADMRKCSKCW